MLTDDPALAAVLDAFQEAYDHLTFEGSLREGVERANRLSPIERAELAQKMLFGAGPPVEVGDAVEFGFEPGLPPTITVRIRKKPDLSRVEFTIVKGE